MKYLLATLLISLTFINAGFAENMAAKEAIMEKTLNLTEELLTAIESAKDEASSKEAVKKIQAIMPKAQALKAESVKAGMDKLTEAEMKALEAKFKDRTVNIQKRLLASLAILQKNPALLGEFQKISQQLK